MLALGIEQYLDDHGISLTYAKSEDSKKPPADSLLLRLQSHKFATPAPDGKPRSGIGIDRKPLAALAQVDPAVAAPYQAKLVAEAMADLGYWPPKFDRTLAGIPLLFGALEPHSLKLLRAYAGEYVSYQYSSRDPERILIGRFTLGPPTQWGYAPVRNHIAQTVKAGTTITYTGIAWHDHNAIHMLLRANVQPIGFPQFIHIDPSSGPEYLHGTALGSARAALRHLTSISLHRAPYPEDDTAIPPEYDRLPELVKRHMLCVLKHGPIDYPVGYIYTPIKPGKPASFAQQAPDKAQLYDHANPEHQRMLSQALNDFMTAENAPIVSRMENCARNRIQDFHAHTPRAYYDIDVDSLYAIFKNDFSPPPKDASGEPLYNLRRTAELTAEALAAFGYYPPKDTPADA